MPISAASRVETQAELAQQRCQALAIASGERVQQVSLGVNQSGDGGIHTQASVVGERHQHAAAVVGVGFAHDETALHEPVDAQRLAGFAAVWLGLLVFSAGAYRRHRTRLRHANAA